jgi:hypothetical protein
MSSEQETLNYVRYGINPNRKGNYTVNINILTSPSNPRCNLVFGKKKGIIIWASWPIQLNWVEALSHVWPIMVGLDSWANEPSLTRRTWSTLAGSIR